MILTTLSCMSVVMNCEAAWAVKPFPAVLTDMFPCLMDVTVFCVHRRRGFRRRSATRL